MEYKSGIKPINEGIGPAYWFLFSHDELLVCPTDNPAVCRIPFMEDIKGFRSGLSDIFYLGLADGKDCFAASLSAGSTREFAHSVSEGHFFAGLRKLYNNIDDDWYWLANRAYHLTGWKRKNVFCGCCGGTLIDSPDEVALNCVKCGNIVYPKISPAIIVAITKEDQILLAHAARFPGRMYSVIAGFVEPGENLEECVRREVLEEVGLNVKNIRYFSSQPWPYPDSLMIAFNAEYESGDLVPDEREITDAGWYTCDNLPELPSGASVARKLIDAWLQNR